MASWSLNRFRSPQYVAPSYMPKAYEGVPNNPSHRDAIVNAFVFVHGTLHQANKRLQKRGGRVMAVTPRHYLDFIHHYVSQSQSSNQSRLHHRGRQTIITKKSYLGSYKKFRKLFENIAKTVFFWRFPCIELHVWHDKGIWEWLLRSEKWFHFESTIWGIQALVDLHSSETVRCLGSLLLSWYECRKVRLYNNTLHVKIYRCGLSYWKLGIQLAINVSCCFACYTVHSWDISA